MFWRIVFWVAVVEVVVCVLPIELTGVTAMIRLKFSGEFGDRHDFKDRADQQRRLVEHGGIAWIFSVLKSR
jgi:hypothetical protein